METSSENIGGSIQASLSGRYATALFDLARESKTIEAVEASLGGVRQALTESEEFRRLVSSPLVGRQAAQKAVLAAADVMGLDPVTRSFLGVLAENRRLSQLPAIIRAFRQLAARHRGETTAEITTAHPLTDDQVAVPDADGELDLSDDQVAALKQQLRQRIGREVAVDLSVDPSLLGGLVVKIGSLMIDSSIKTRLNSLAHAMKG